MRTKNQRILPFILISCLLAFPGCRRKIPNGGNGSNNTTVDPVDIEFSTGDPSVPAELGGPGFSGEGWLTSSPGALGDPRAVKGGAISTYIPSWPENLRPYGTGSNTWLNHLVQEMCYESLCGAHPQTLETIPALATHWKISEDNMTFSFRINPQAHWSDGKPVVAQDWVTTYRLINDDTLLEPMTKQALCGKMHEPRVLSKYMLEVDCKEKSWRNFLAFSGMTPLPAHEIEGITGDEFLEKYNFSYTATSGPYIVRPEDIKKNESLTLTRRDAYWAKDDESHVGLFNFDKVRFVVVREPRLAFEKTCKGQLDFYPVNTAKWWVEDIGPLDVYKRGQLIKREIFTKFPKSIQGMAFNMRKPPLDDVRLRKALGHLYDRRTMLTKFAYDQYIPLQSYYPGSDAENPDNQSVEYDPKTAIELLTESGWTERGTDGVLIKDGERLSLTLMYRSEGFEKYLTSYQEACRKVGVEINLKRVTPETHWKNMMERSFEFASMGWGASLYPAPKSGWSSMMADKPGSNNITGFKNEEADAIIEEYDAEFDVTKRNQLLRNLDAIIHENHPYALDWYLPSERLIYWNKFGMPDYGLNRYHEYENAFSTWWYDEEKANRLKATLKSGETMGPIPEMRLRAWDGKPNPLETGVKNSD